MSFQPEVQLPSQLELIEMHVEALFLHDDRDRLVAVNDVKQGPAPRLYLGRTVESNIWRFRHNLSPELIAELEAILGSEPLTTDLEQPAATMERLHDTLSRDTPVERIWEGPAWHFPEQVETSPGIEVQRITPDRPVQDVNFLWLTGEIEFCQPVFVVMDEGRIVSLCHSSRNTSVTAEAGVETLEGYRGRGYATAVVTAWARAVRAEGREPLYSTHWGNNASLALAGRLGLILYGADLHMA